MPEKLFEELAQLEQVEAVVLGGSRAGEQYDQDSDYDVYVYLKDSIAPKSAETYWASTARIWKSKMNFGNWKMTAF